MPGDALENVRGSRSNEERLARAKSDVGAVIESGVLDDYPNGQLGVAHRIVEKYENVLAGRGAVEEGED